MLSFVLIVRLLMATVVASSATEGNPETVQNAKSLIVAVDEGVGPAPIFETANRLPCSSRTERDAFFKVGMIPVHLASNDIDVKAYLELMWQLLFDAEWSSKYPPPRAKR